MATHQALLPVEKVQFLLAYEWAHLLPSSLAAVEANGLPASFPIWQVGCHVVIEVEGQRRQTTTVPPSSHSNAEWDVNFPFDLSSHVLLSTADRTALISIRIYQSYALLIGSSVFTIPMGQQKAACPTVTIALKVQHVVATEKDTLGAPGSTDGMSNEGSSQLTLTNVAIEGQLANDGVGPHDARGSIEVRTELLKKLDEGEHQSIHAGHVSGAPSHTIDSTLSLNVTDQENTRKDDVADGNSTLTLQSTGDETRSYTSRESTRSSKEGGQQSIHSDDGGNSQSNPTVGDDGSSKVSGKSVKAIEMCPD
ncbi:hypothetical protein BV22DRAFT_1050133 [Leucogyrophana mollusca]|uniref:Uncharacterized protein n=1 Tax=Leucogyrophana mollusca TaxID=85980 RepID=A0ACB8B684_9AGAM|nr:hypothetical protein BV22DRAFT_1050133 [Leucogyrophana mollusca]